MSNLAAVTAWVREAAEKAGLGPRAVYQVEMALDEAFANVVEHAYAGAESGDVQISCFVEREDFVLVLRDWGRSFDPDSVPEPDLEAALDERRLGGLGLHFMRELMDAVDHRVDKEGNRLRMTKSLVG
jgi:serine/threonine-protein kinase RsbW